jgi:hypothetical protein
VQVITKARRFWQSRRFDWAVSEILNTAPLEPKEDEPTIVSMLCHADIMMYLLAIKSFYHCLGRGRIVIINDGTLSSQDVKLLNDHVKPSEIIKAESLNSAICPRYISWKKLFCIANCIKDSFTIQLDSDTLTVGEITEVRQHIDTGTSFILGTWKNQEIGSMSEAVQAARANPSEHVQMVAERNFDKLPDFRSLRYVRGCSGFDGFARNLFELHDLEELSQQMFKLIGNKWNEWGSEQTASNIIVANATKSRVLPYPKYYSYWGDAENATFVHFVGTHRYSSGLYAREAKQVIKALRT